MAKLRVVLVRLPCRGGHGQGAGRDQHHQTTTTRRGCEDPKPPVLVGASFVGEEQIRRRPRRGGERAVGGGALNHGSSMDEQAAAVRLDRRQRPGPGFPEPRPAGIKVGDEQIQRLRCREEALVTRLPTVEAQAATSVVNETNARRRTVPPDREIERGVGVGEGGVALSPVRSCVG